MSFLDVVFKWHCQLNRVYSTVLFVVKDHVGLGLRNNDVNWEGTSSCRVSADVTKKGEVIICRLNETFQSTEHGTFNMCFRMELWCQVLQDTGSGGLYRGLKRVMFQKH